MATVMCSSELHKALGHCRLQGTVGAPGGPVRLGDWAATLAGRERVVVIDERTCLTLVLRLLPIATFRDRLAAALRRALLARGASLDEIARECTALRQAPFVRRRHPALSEALGFAEIETDAHAEDGQQECSLQAMLNAYPYGECAASCPSEAVALLFRVPSRS